MDIDDILIKVMYFLAGLFALLVIIAIIAEDNYTEYKYRVIEDGYTRGYTNQKVKDGCIEINTGKVCGTFFIKLNQAYKK